MTAETPNCHKCGTPYFTPAHYQANFGLCENCRPIKLCAACGGRGMTFTETKSGHGKWRDCEHCNGTRHEPAVSLPCLCCGKPHWFSLRSHEANGVFNVFCNAECEDRYAARQ